MFDGYLRALKDRLMGPVARAMGPGVPPNWITALGLAAGLASAGAVATGRVYSGLALWLVNRALDGLDGAQARVHGRESPFGAYLDIVLDFVVYAAIPLGFVYAAGSRQAAVAGLLLLISFYINAASWMYLAAILEQRRDGAAARGDLTTVTMPPGVIGGTETVVFYTLFFLLPSHVVWLFRLMAALVLVNVAWRLRWARRHLGP